MKHSFRAIVLALVILLCGTTAALAAPFPVDPTPSESGWEGWGYVVDNQTSGNWFSVMISWGTDAAMSGSYVILEDFLFQIDPSTSGLSDPSSVYGEDFWNHDGIYGLGEFFDAGLETNDRNYVFDLNLDGPNSTWSVWYDADRDMIKDGGSEHVILGGVVESYWDQDGYFYGVLAEADGIYDGYFASTHNEGTPNVLNGTFHAGYGDPVPIPAVAWLFGSGLLGLAGLRRKFRS